MLTMIDPKQHGQGATTAIQVAAVVFLSNTLYSRIVNIPAKMVDETISSPFADTPVVLQGAVDLLIVDKDGIIIVDYKTDRVKNSDDLLRMYSKQLNLYKEAVSQIFSKPVKSCLIYSVHLNEIKEVYV